MSRLPTTLSIAALAALGLTAGTAGLAQAKPAPPVAPVAGTHQTIGFPNDGSTYTTEIDFATSTFTIPEFGDSGVYKDAGSSLTLTIKKSAERDKGCVFTGTYDATSTDFSGTYTCKKDVNDFFVTTDGATG